MVAGIRKYNSQERKSLRAATVKAGKLLPQHKSSDVGGPCVLTTGKGKKPRRIRNPLWKKGSKFESPNCLLRTKQRAKVALRVSIFSVILHLKSLALARNFLQFPSFGEGSYQVFYGAEKGVRPIKIASKQQQRGSFLV